MSEAKLMSAIRRELRDEHSRGHRLGSAYGLAMCAHRGQTRRYTGDPFMTHPSRVAGIVRGLEGATIEMEMVAYLHDVLEDTEITAADLNGFFGTHVSDIVRELTNEQVLEGLSRVKRKEMDRERLATASVAAKTIKLADMLDNYTDMNHPEATKTFVKLYVEEGFELLEVLRDAHEALAKRVEKAINDLKVWNEGR